jgi:hypothetical protein
VVLRKALGRAAAAAVLGALLAGSAVACTAGDPGPSASGGAESIAHHQPNAKKAP